jgi:hypothetical protein
MSSSISYHPKNEITHLLPVCESPRFFNSPLRVATVSPFQLLWEDNKTADAKFADCCCIGLAPTAADAAVALEEAAEVAAVDLDAALNRPVETLRRIIVKDMGMSKYM